MATKSTSTEEPLASMPKPMKPESISIKMSLNEPEPATTDAQRLTTGAKTEKFNFGDSSFVIVQPVYCLILYVNR